MFLPTTQKEVKERGWDQLDIILVSGDSYVDSSYIGVSVIGRVLEHAGFKVGIIAQPDTKSDKDITRLGEPRLFWGVSGGAVDSMVANYTATNKRRKLDDMTPGGKNDRRPDRAVIFYSNLIRRYFKDTCPIVLGGIEASLRRVAHYDYWSNSIRKSILFDAKADYLIYGMGEQTTVRVARALHGGKNVTELPGLCYISREKPVGLLELPSFRETADSKNAFTEMFRVFYQNNDHISGESLTQKQDTRYLVINKPAQPLAQRDLDFVYGLPYERDVHPYYAKGGKVTALDTIRFSLTTHRGCHGECNFCTITVHQGRTVTWRSPDGIVEEGRQMTHHPDFKGNILDVGGPSANMYGYECKVKLAAGGCQQRRCIFPEVCAHIEVDHSSQTALLKRLRKLNGVKKVFVASGIRYDLVLEDKKYGPTYLQEVVKHHVSGQMKIAPEHVDDRVLELMGKPGLRPLLEFRKAFTRSNRQSGKKQFLSYYLIAAHPGCSEEQMRQLKKTTSQELKINPEQVQVFTPLPSTWSAVMYYTERDPFSDRPIFVEKDNRRKDRQKQIVTEKRR